MNIFGWLDNLSQQFMIVFGAALILIVGLVDFITGSELSFSIFYLLPIGLLAWFVDRRAGLIAAFISAIIWLVADLSAGQTYSSSAIPYWNTTVRLGFFVIVTYALASLRAAEQRQEELGHFIVHDLRAPVSNIIVALNFLLEISGATMDEDENKLVRMGIASANRTLTLINTLLDLARLERGKMELNRAATAVDDLFSLAAEQVSALADRRDVDVALDIDINVNSVIVDKELTLRVLVNLLSNALKYSPPQSIVTLQAVPQDGMIAIRTIDAGSGIPEAWAKKVFHKFTQVEASKAGVGVGSGLGLSFCRYAIEAQGGRIWVETGVAQGTTITFTLPGIVSAQSHGG